MNLVRALKPFVLCTLTLDKSSRNPTKPRHKTVARQSKTMGLSGRAQSNVASTTAHKINTPPMVGVPRFAPAFAASDPSSSAPRMGWPNFNSVSFRIIQGPLRIQMSNAVIAAKTARNVVY